MKTEWIQKNPNLYTPTYDRRDSRGVSKDKFLLFYDFSSFISTDFRASLTEHLADYDEYVKERERILEYQNPECRLEFYPPFVNHFIKTFIDNYEFLRYMLYLYKNTWEEEMDVYLITGTDFTDEEKELIVKCLQKCRPYCKSLDTGSYDGMISRVQGVLNFVSRDKLISDINYIRDHTPHDEYVEYKGASYWYSANLKPRFLLISANDYSDVFEKNSMVPEDEGVILNLNYQRAYYLLFNADSEYCYVRRDYEKIDPKFYDDRIIFLDIDGVLNHDCYNGNSEHEYFNEGMVKELSRLVRKTNAKIILTSSWRDAFIKRIHRYSFYREEIFDEFLKLLQRENIYISGLTPDGDLNGSITRPLEIRSWLFSHPEIKSFVILDDDTFWTWGYLRQNVVTTTTLLSDEEIAELEKTTFNPARRIDGLTREFADKAAEILMRDNDACIMLDY